MSLTSSKKKIQPSKTHKEDFSNVIEEGGNPYQSLMKIIQNSSECIIKTPSKRHQNNHKNYKIALMKWNELSAKKYGSHPPSSLIKKSPDLSVIRIKVEIKRRQISKLSYFNAKLLQVIYMRRNLKIQLLRSLKQKEDIKQIMEQEQEKLNKVRQMMDEKNKEYQNRKQQIESLETNKKNLQQKLKICQQTNSNLEERKKNMMYAVQAQMKKNNLMKIKLQEQKAQRSKMNIIPRLAQELFTILILSNQIKNCQEINKRQCIFVPKTNNKRKSTSVIRQNSQNYLKKMIEQKGEQKYCMFNSLKLCPRENAVQHNNKSYSRTSICIQLQSLKCQKQKQVRENSKSFLSKMPYTLFVISSIYMHLKIKDLDRKYFNKISYFCEKTKTIFQYDRFVSIVEGYFAQRKNNKLRYESSNGQQMHMVKLQVDRDATGMQSQQTKGQEITFDGQIRVGEEQEQGENNETEIRMTISSKCLCGDELQRALLGENLQSLLKKYLNIKIISIQKSESCCCIEVVEKLERNKLNCMNE